MKELAYGSLRVCILLTFGMVSAAPVWVPFDNNTPGPVPPSLDIVSADVNHVKLHVVAHGMFSEDTFAGGDTFQVLSFSEEGTMGDLGLPQLPQVTRIIGFAPGATVTISVEYGDELELAGSYYVFPAQYPLDDSDPDPNYPFVIDSAVYGTDAYFPGTDGIGSDMELGAWRDIGVAVGIVRPLMFNPVEQKLLVYRSVYVDYTFADGAPLPTEVSPERYRAYAGSVSNFEYLGIADADRVLPMKYMILLGNDDEALRQAIEPLRVWKTLQGYDVQIRCVSSNDIPRDTTAIKNWIHWAFVMNPQCDLFFLLVGDCEEIPVPLGPYDACSDHWYADVYSPPTQPYNDFIADVDLGRIPSANPATVSQVVQKFMWYERYIHPAWEKTGSLMVSHVNTSHNEGYIPCKEGIADLYEALGLSCIRRPGNDPAVTNSLVQSDINGVIQMGGVGIVNYRGHGQIDKWGIEGTGWNRYGEFFTNTEILELGNSHWLPLVYEICCACGRIDDSHEGHCEAWVEGPCGAVAVWAAPRTTNTEPNHTLDTALFTVPYDRQITYTCVVMNAAEMEMLRVWPRYAGIRSVQLYHLMGDPSLHVWTADSGGLALTWEPRSIPPGQTCWVDAWVRHSTTSAPVRDAAVGLYKAGDDVLQYARTDASGHASLLVYVPTPGLMTITATKPLFHGTEDFVHVTDEDTGTSGRQGVEAAIPCQFRLWVQPVSNGRLRIGVETPKATELQLGVYDAAGRAVAPTRGLWLTTGATWFEPLSSSAEHSGLSPGSYFIRYTSELGCGLLKTTVTR
jgi:hypothetical protein